MTTTEHTTDAPVPSTPLRTYKLDRRPLPNMKVASSTDLKKQPTNFVSVKRPRKSLGINPEGAATDYATDPVAQKQLLAACQAAGYPLFKGETGGGLCTSRVPVYVLGMTLEDMYESRRSVHNGAGDVCTCAEWRLKGPQECEADGLPFDAARPEDYQDDEA